MKKRAHFIGIAGMGMSAVAILLKEQGWKVSGSDSEAYAPATTQLKRHGIPLHSTYKSSNVPKHADVIVIGMNAKLTREHNPEVKAAYESGIRITSFPEILGEIVEHRKPIVIAGSYGKSTITSLIAWCLSYSNVDAGWFVGAAPENMEPSHLGTHPVFVLEGDEYPTSRTDTRPKFAHYHAHDALITAASHDHVNIYKKHEDFLKPFRALVTSLPKEGMLLFCGDEPHASSLAQGAKARAISYGMTTASEWHPKNISYGDTTTFDLMRGAEKITMLSTTLIGAHNIENIVGASAILLEKKLLGLEKLAAALHAFKGLARRLDKKTIRSSVPAYEGFGSSREKLRSAISALSTQYPDKRLVVVFEPHTFSWRNKNMLHWFDTAFEGAGLVVLYKPAEQGASTHEQSSQKEMLVRVAASGVDVAATYDPKTTMQVLEKTLNTNDVVLLSSSGPMDGLIEQIPKWLDNTFA